MTHHEATAILNQVREGRQFSEFVILRALELTGDYEAIGSNGMDQAIQKKSLEEGRGEAHYWFQQVIADIAKKRGQAAADELRKRMNRIKNETSSKG